MPSETRPDPDLPTGAGRAAGLHLRFGRLLVGMVNLVRPRTTLGVRLAAFDPEGRVLLVRQSYTPGWHLPGGGVDRGETCGAAAIREAREEGGLVACSPPELFGIYHNEALAGRDHVVLFVAREARTAARRPRSLEVREVRFFGAGELPEDATPATRARLSEVAEGRQTSDRW